MTKKINKHGIYICSLCGQRWLPDLYGNNCPNCEAQIGCPAKAEDIAAARAIVGQSALDEAKRKDVLAGPCIGYPDCDGDLEGESHSEKCPAGKLRGAVVGQGSEPDGPALEKRLKELSEKWRKQADTGERLSKNPENQIEHSAI